MREEPEGVPTLLEFREEFDRVNTKYFDGRIPHYRLAWNHRLRRTGGQVSYSRRVIELSSWLMWYDDNGKDAFRTLHHEMIHAYLDAIGHNSNHTREFKDWLAQLGHTRNIHHSMRRPQKPRQYTPPVYRDHIAYYCRDCSKTTIAQYDSDWVRFDYIIEHWYNNNHILCNECDAKLIMLNTRGYTTRTKAIEKAHDHNSLATYEEKLVRHERYY